MVRALLDADANPELPNRLQVLRIADHCIDDSRLTAATNACFYLRLVNVPAAPLVTSHIPPSPHEVLALGHLFAFCFVMASNRIESRTWI